MIQLKIYRKGRYHIYICDTSLSDHIICDDFRKALNFIKQNCIVLPMAILLRSLMLCHILLYSYSEELISKPITDYVYDNWRHLSIYEKLPYLLG